jgi:hypothetical protein
VHLGYIIDSKVNLSHLILFIISIALFSLSIKVNPQLIWRLSVFWLPARQHPAL